MAFLRDPFARFGRSARVVRQVLENRGIASPDALDYSLKTLHSPDTLSGLKAAVALLLTARREQWRILVIGDFDCDGATSCAIALRGLRKLGFAQVDFRVPHRISDGYGLSARLVNEVALLKPDLLITADMGVMSHAGVARAKALNLRVLITDHHLPGVELPIADAIVNPNLDGDGFPSKALCGAGVVFYLLIALRAALLESGELSDPQSANLGGLLDLLALATVADLVPLDHNNRVLVAQGLKRIRAGEMCHGIRALFLVAKRDHRRASAQDLGFAIAPRINAAGRLEDMRLGVECLLADDPDSAMKAAERLDQVNRERRDLQEAMVDSASALIGDRFQSIAALPAGLVVWDPMWHEGVVGLVASKLKERLKRPVIALAPAQGERDCWKGSARSIEGVHLRDILALIDAAAPQLLTRFGGHAMAAGLTVPTAALNALAERFSMAVADAQMRSGLVQSDYHDGALAAGEISYELATTLHDLGPWGQAFPEPRFQNVFEISKITTVAERHRRFTLKLTDSNLSFRAMEFFADFDKPTPSGHTRVTYTLERDEFRGELMLGLRICGFS